MKHFLSGTFVWISIMTVPVISVPTLQWERSQVVLASNISDTLAAKETRNLLPVEHPIQSYWMTEPDANPLATEGSHGDLTVEADVCIIGSGITGVSAAYHLSQLQGKSPLSAVILEARDFCSGATGRNGGHFTANLFHDFVLRESLYGTEEAIKTFDLESYTAQALLAIISHNELRDKVDLVSSQHNTAFLTKEEEEIVKADWAAAIAAGVDLDKVNWRNAEEMKQTFGTPFSAVTFPGNNLFPLKLVTELFKLAEDATSSFKLGLHTHTPVTSIEKLDAEQAKRRWALQTPRGEVHCNYVIHATNAYANHLVPTSATSPIDQQLSSGIIITPTRGQVIALRAGANESRITKSSWGANEGFEYWFPRPVRRTNIDEEENPLVIIGGGREAAPGFEVGVIDDGSVSKEVGKALKDFLPGIFTGPKEDEVLYSKGREPEQEWTGIMGFTKSGDPFVGPVPGYDGQYVSAGYSGHGMTRAYACAEVVANMVHSAVTGEAWRLPDWMPKHYLITP